MRFKSGLESLACFGGPAAFALSLHVNRPNKPMRAAFEQYLDTAWDTSWFTNDGRLVQSLESRLSTYLEVKDCVLTSNATLGLMLVLQALGIRGEVIVPAYTFISTANVLQLSGLSPVFCEVGSDDMNIDCDDLASRINERTAAVIATHVWGTPCDTERLEALCRDSGLVLLYDSAHAFGVRHAGRPIGGFGRAEIFSLHATKVLHAFEGGVISTNDAALAAELRLRRNFGFSGSDQVDLAGINAKLSEPHAAMGLANLDQIDATIDASRAVHDAYVNGLADIDGLYLHRPALGTESNYHYVVVEVDAAIFGLSRDMLMTVLSAENVLARRYFYPGGHRSTPHLPKVGHPVSLPKTEALCDRVLVLPGGAAMAVADVERVCALIRIVAENAGEIATRL